MSWHSVADTVSWYSVADTVSWYSVANTVWLTTQVYMCLVLFVNVLFVNQNEAIRIIDWNNHISCVATCHRLNLSSPTTCLPQPWSIVLDATDESSITRTATEPSWLRPDNTCALPTISRTWTIIEQRENIESIQQRWQYYRKKWSSNITTLHLSTLFSARHSPDTNCSSECRKRNRYLNEFMNTISTMLDLIVFQYGYYTIVLCSVIICSNEWNYRRM